MPRSESFPTDKLPRLDPQRQYVIGTAGHIDHGKTALVKALTGVDTDRLPEEKERGITIDIGFAHLSKNVTIIDVPGHERLIKNMVAGVSTIDMVLFVVAADDGVMPQSREHLDIINLLRIRHGLFVITKTDLADEDWLALVEEDIRSLLQGTPFESAPVLKTSTAAGQGIDELHQEIFALLSRIPPRQDQEIYRQPIDRVFSAKGFGTVITGTVLGGRLKTGDAVEIQPAGLAARVRGLQSHDSEVPEVQIGYRAAVNLAGVEMEQVHRGMALTQPDLFRPVHILNARVNVLAGAAAPLKNNQRIRLHLHTAEVFARVVLMENKQIAPGQSGYVQLRLEEAVHAAYQDRFIIRQYSPQRTLGGGEVLQANPARFRAKFREIFLTQLNRLASDDPPARLPGAFDLLKATPLKLWEIKIATGLPLSDLQRLLKEQISAGQVFTENIGGKTYYFSREQLEMILRQVEPLLSAYHSQFPGRGGMPEAELISKFERRFPAEAIRRAVRFGEQVKRLKREEQLWRMSDFTPQLSARDSLAYADLEKEYREAGFSPPTVKEVMAKYNLSPADFKELIKLLRDEGKLVYVDPTLLFHSSVFPQLERLLQEYFKTHDHITVAEFKELTGTTRKHSIPLLTYLDTRGVTERDGDVRRPGYKLR